MHVINLQSLIILFVIDYRKPPTISPGLYLFVSRLIHGGGLIYGQDFVLVILTIY